MNSTDYSIKIETISHAGHCKSSINCLIGDRLKQVGVTYFLHYGTTSGPASVEEARENIELHLKHLKLDSLDVIVTTNPETVSSKSKRVVLLIETELSHSTIVQFYLQYIVPAFQNVPGVHLSLTNELETHLANPACFPFYTNARVTISELFISEITQRKHDVINFKKFY